LKVLLVLLQKKQLKKATAETAEEVELKRKGS
jgi:hypothetical protein